MLERKLVRGVDCGGEGGLGARLWFVSTRFVLRAAVVCVDEGWTWRAAVDCGGVGWAWCAAWIASARVGLGRGWIVGARLGLAQGCGLWGRGLVLVRGVIEAAVKRRCGKKVRKVANL